jgi:uncharacterized coiled-coil protein SlyX
MTDATINQLIGSVATLVGTFLGFLTATLNERFRDQRTRAREVEARAEARRLHLFERRTDFQRETLLRLQDAVFELSRVVSKMNHLERMEYKKAGTWGKLMFPEELDDDSLKATVKTSMYMVRVRDQGIREMATTFRNLASKLNICKTPVEAEQTLMEMMAAIPPLHECIGIVLRKLDDEENLEETK